MVSDGSWCALVFAAYSNNEFINAKKIKVKCTLIQSQSTVFSCSQAMAQRKETLKMICLKSVWFSEC